MPIHIRDEREHNLQGVEVEIGAVVTPEAGEGVLGGNWMRFFMKSLPQAV